MPRDIPVGNGNILVAFDKSYLLREFYFPFPGEESHTVGAVFHFGIWVDGKFSWIPDGWKIEKDYLDDSLIANVSLINDSLGIKILANDLVDFHENIYLRKIEVENLSNQEKEVRLFFGQDFNIYGTGIGDTAAYKPDVHGLLHYKHDRYFLVNVYANNKFGIDHFATGNKGSESFEGTWKDAEDGILSRNPIAQGSVDSVAGVHFLLKPKINETCYYWISAGKTWDEVKELNEVVKKKTPAVLLKRTFDYWKLWVNKEELNYSPLPEKVTRLYKKSLLICRTQINNAGAIIAGNDSDVIYFNRDTYSYMWPRDGALAAYALDLAGFTEITRKFFEFCSKIITKEGYFLHKYTPRGTLASSWHPWEKANKPQLPIQEDETALVIWALWNHFKLFKDVEFIKALYKPLIIRAADFMMDYRDHKTGLPLLSYDLWEERQGILTFTLSTVYGGLIAAANFAEVFGELNLAEEYREGAASIRQAMDKYLYLEKEKRFARCLYPKDGSYEVDKTIDASLFGIFAFGVYSADDEKVKNTMSQIESALWVKTEVGGIARYENDPYYRAHENYSNPWFVTTLWLAQYYIAISKNEEDLKKAMKILEWTADHAMPSGVLAEQVNPHTHEPLSVSPLTWSHSTYIATVQEYLEKLQSLKICSHCGLTKFRKKGKS